MTEQTKKLITIAGHAFNIRQPFAMGHVLTEGEALQLNQTFAENVRNNLAPKVKIAFSDEPTDELNPNTIEAFVADYDAAYEMTVAPAGAKRVTDPIEVEARAIARNLLNDYMKKKGSSLLKLDADVREANIAKVAAQESVRKMAQKNIAERAKRADEALGSIDLSGLDAVDAVASAKGDNTAAE